MTGDEAGGVEEDEDVVIAGSELHDALRRMGNTDYEIASVVKSELPETCDPCPASDNPSSLYRKIRDRFSDVCRCMMQESGASENQLRTILQARPLLDDHAKLIQSFLKENHHTFWKKVFNTVPLVCGTVAIATGILFGKHKSILPWLVALPVMTASAHHKYTQRRANRDLKRLVSLQNDTYSHFKRGLRILRYSYGIKLGPNKSGSKFTDLGAQRLKFLQPMLEVLLRSVGGICSAYYRATQIILDLLPTSCQTDFVSTHFEDEHFLECGEVSYESFKQLYYTYILIQSEMLQLLAVAYNSNTWQGHNKIPETRLSCIIYNLLRLTNVYKSTITKAIDTFHNCRFETVHHEYRGSVGSKWQDLYVHTDSTLHKIQMAYNHLASILSEIDSRVNNEEDDAGFIHKMQQQMEDAYKEIDNARDFAEFSRLLMAKMQNVAGSEGRNIQEDSSLAAILKSEAPLVRDTEPQIDDEVFEEFIKEEYLKPLYDDGDDCAHKNHKLDKLLTKNFMSELKEVLVDKHKAMSERERRALERMRKNIAKTSSSDDEQNSSDVSSDSDYDATSNPPSTASRLDTSRDYENVVKIEASGLKTENNFIPPPPPPPVWNRDVPSTSGKTLKRAGSHVNQESAPMSHPPEIPPCVSGEKLRSPMIEGNDNTNAVSLNYPPPMPMVLALDVAAAVNEEEDRRGQEFQTSLGFRLYPFSGAAEEMFIGSGENSEDELVDDAAHGIQ